MKYYGKFREVRLSSVKPEGWLRKMLENEKNGIPGHLNEIGYPFNKLCWKTKEATESWASNWWPYEQSAYWVDSLVRTAALLDDPALYEKVREQVDCALEQADPYIGPDIIRGQGPCYRWPHAVFFRALTALWSKTGDEKYLDAMYRHYKADDFEYGTDRNVMALESMMRVAYEKGDEALLDKAIAHLEHFLEVYRPGSDYFFSYCNGLPEELLPREDTGCMFSYLPAVFHGVSYNETAKMPALAYLYTGKREYLELSQKVYRVIDDRHLMADGINSSGEALHGRDALAVHESCDITDYCWSMGYLLQATGDARYADAIERAMLNAYPAAIDRDYRSMQYFSAVNQVIAAHNTSYRPNFMDEKMAYQGLHNPQCCAGNLGRALPNFALRMYQETDRGAVISLYGDSEYTGPHMSLRQTGAYPYGDECYIDVTAADAHNELLLRIPGWSVRTRILQNGREVDIDPVNGYAALTVSAGDRITLCTKKLLESHDNSDGGVYFTYGPFTMALSVAENVEIDRTARLWTEDFPAYNLTPLFDWGYAVTGYECPVMIQDGKDPDLQAPNEPGFILEITARILKDWKLAKKASKNGERLFTPPIPSQSFIKRHLGKEVKIRLVPIGCTLLRLTVFPRCGELKQ